MAAGASLTTAKTDKLRIRRQFICVLPDTPDPENFVVRFRAAGHRHYPTFPRQPLVSVEVCAVRVPLTSLGRGVGFSVLLVGGSIYWIVQRRKRLKG